MSWASSVWRRRRWTVQPGCRGVSMGRSQEREPVSQLDQQSIDQHLHSLMQTNGLSWMMTQFTSSYMFQPSAMIIRCIMTEKSKTPGICNWKKHSLWCEWAQPKRWDEELHHLGERRVGLLLLHIEWKRLRWSNHLIGMSPGCLSLEVFQALLTGRRTQGRPRTHLRNNISFLTSKNY